MLLCYRFGLLGTWRGSTALRLDLSLPQHNNVAVLPFWTLVNITCVTSVALESESRSNIMFYRVSDSEESPLQFNVVFKRASHFNR